MGDCELVIRANFDSIAQVTEGSLLFVDEETAESLAVLYMLNSLYETFNPLAFQCLAGKQECGISLGKKGRVVFLLSSFLWDKWDLVRDTVRSLQFSGDESSSLVVSIFCGMSDNLHQNLREDFSPSNTTAYG